MIINGFKTKADAIRAIRGAGFNISGLLASPESNPKVAKNGKLGVMTAPLHLAPYDLSGFQVCAQASKGCAAACLHTAGNPVYMAQKQKSRIAKTQAYFKCRDAFMALLAFEIAALARKAESQGMQAGIRLNATSDLPWELRKINVNGADHLIMEYFANVEFYDYTKITKRALAWAAGKMPRNYHLTFSKTEANDNDVSAVIKAGGNVAMVFAPSSLKLALSDGAIQSAWGFSVPVIDGDDHDFRPADPRGVVVALKAKGDAKGDKSGFVIDWHGEYAA